MSKQVFSTEFAGRTLTLETGLLALQANASCTLRYGDTVVMATAVMGGVREGVDFFPLSVEYEERLYAAGKIKGSRWIKREGRPSDEAVLSGRLIDRSIRPLFDKSMKNEVQVVLTVLSFDQENDSDVLSLLAASAVLSISDIPWEGPLGGVRVGRINGEWVINPSFEARQKSDLDLVVSGMDGKVLMIEAEGQEISEPDMAAAIEFALKHMQTAVTFFRDVASKIGKPKKVLVAPAAALVEDETPESHKELLTMAQAWIEQNVPQILFDKTLPTKTERKAALAKAYDQLMVYLEQQGVGKERRKLAADIFEDYIEYEVPKAILRDGTRVDGRSLTDIRSLSCDIGILPRTHGSGLFNRGETQVLSIVTLGSPGDEQFLEGLEENGRKRYMHHYNFPPYSVGETGRLGAPGRREIGHGALAEKALRPMIPPKEEFPYTIRVVSEVLGSNGSSSMASTCGSTLALMDAGVPIKKPVAGVAMGLASDDQGNWKVLTDLQDMEDGMGGMDFKIAGTDTGITAIQLDTKTKGLGMDIVHQTLTQAREARLTILQRMLEVIPAVRPTLSPYAPRIISFKINPEKIREVIGPGGKVINEIIAATGVQIDIEQDGTVMVTSVNEAAGKQAIDWINNIIREVQVGEVFEGKVSRIMDFGAIVDILPGQDGMVHVSELAHSRIAHPGDVLKLGDVVKVKVVNVEPGGRIGLSIKALTPRPERAEGDQPDTYDRPRPPRRGPGHFDHRGRAGSRH